MCAHGALASWRLGRLGAARMSRREPRKRGIPWRDGAWFLKQVDPDGVLSPAEQAAVVEIGDGWAQRSADAPIFTDLYGWSWRLVEVLRTRLHVEHRSPLPAVDPVNLTGRNR